MGDEGERIELVLMSILLRSTIEQSQFVPQTFIKSNELTARDDARVSSRSNRTDQYQGNTAPHHLFLNPFQTSKEVDQESNVED